MSDIIYSDQACALLEYLGDQSGDTKLVGPANIAALLDLDAQQYQRAKGKKGGKGWPFEYGPKDARRPYDFVDNLAMALNFIAQEYRSPRRFMRVANLWLRRSGIEILQLAAILDETPDTWQGSYPEEDANFVRFRDCIIERCHRECSSMATSGTVAPSRAVDPDPMRVHSLPWLAHAIISDVSCTIAVDNGLQMPWEADGAGHVAGVGADSFEELFDQALPHALKSRLYAATRSENPAAELSDPIYYQCVRDVVMAHFLRDNGHQFVTMVGNCRMLLAPATDAGLLMARCTSLFRRLSSISRDPGAVMATLGHLRRYAQGDAARVLASMILALMVGPEHQQVLGSVTQRR